MKRPRKGKIVANQTSALSTNTAIDSKSNQFPIVGIGASTGGLDALE